MAMKPTLIAVALAATGFPRGIVSVRITRGDIVNTVVASGTLEAVTTVQGGSQLSGADEPSSIAAASLREHRTRFDFCG